MRTCGLPCLTNCHLQGGLQDLRHIIKMETGWQGHFKTPGTVEVTENGKSKATTTFHPQMPQKQSCRLRFRGVQGSPSTGNLNLRKLSEKQILEKDLLSYGCPRQMGPSSLAPSPHPQWRCSNSCWMPRRGDLWEVVLSWTHLSVVEVRGSQLWNQAAEVQSLCLQPPNGVMAGQLNFPVSVSSWE